MPAVSSHPPALPRAPVPEGQCRVTLSWALATLARRDCHFAEVPVTIKSLCWSDFWAQQTWDSGQAEAPLDRLAKGISSCAAKDTGGGEDEYTDKRELGIEQHPFSCSFWGVVDALTVPLD